MIVGEICGGVISADLLWIDLGAALTIHFPDLGIVAIPPELQNRRSSTLIPNIKLSYVEDSLPV